ncbi:hypothetical protein KOI35_25750 [Actinoplanes bogorensis]|uniref:Pyruvate, phosphate dikinase n=2 Tax=Paractinoplanes bogorensis TaxID=1610840 RepID=A0ABS5YV24_9ACTN|nr:hypothetical protein [Actinoplanes bogorensis]
MRLGLPVPAGFVIGVDTALRDPGAVARAAERLGAAAVSVRSGAAVSMPGMMDTVLDVRGPIAPVVAEVYASWNTPRAVTYRELRGIPHHLGTAVIVQTMVYGDRDDHSGSGVAFSRDPATGAPHPYGDVLFGRRGDAVVSGSADTLPLTSLATREPAVWASLTGALTRLEQHYRNVCHVEFTYESGHLWLLQARPGGLTPQAAVRAAVDLTDEGLITPPEAVRRITPEIARAATPRMRPGDIVARGRGASPGVATGRVTLTADAAARTPGRSVLVRPTTSPLDMHGLAAAAGVITARGGLASHAAIVARALGKPAVVGAGDLAALTAGTLVTLDGTTGEIALGDPGTTEPPTDPHLHRLLTWADNISGDHSPRPAENRLAAAHALL